MFLFCLVESEMLIYTATKKRTASYNNALIEKRNTVMDM